MRAALIVFFALIASACSASPEVAVEDAAAVESGTEAILAAQEAGEPYILWFWGAN